MQMCIFIYLFFGPDLKTLEFQQFFCFGHYDTVWMCPQVSRPYLIGCLPNIRSVLCFILVLDCSPILSSFQVILLEHIIMCRLVTGHKATALQEVCSSDLLGGGCCFFFFSNQFGANKVVWFEQISQVCQLCQQSPRLFSNHAAQLHTLLVSPHSTHTTDILRFNVWADLNEAGFKWGLFQLSREGVVLP